MFSSVQGFVVVAARKCMLILSIPGVVSFILYLINLFCLDLRYVNDMFFAMQVLFCPRMTGFISLFPDAEITENHIQQVFDIHAAGQAAQIPHG